MNSRLYIVALVLGLMTFSSSCKKDPGEGGTSTIKGKLLVKHISGAPPVDSTYYGNNTKAYIIYGTANTAYDDDYDTSFDGTYQFKYLQNGTYKIFAYSIDTTGYSQGFLYANRPKVPVFATVEITDKNQTVEVPDIVIFKYN
jgi:hypothetical protein